MNQAQWIIGADPSADLWINDPNISRDHCLLIRTDTGYTLQDRGSTNGTFCNGVKIESTAVSPADEIMLARRVSMPWPDSTISQQVITIGYDAECDYQIDDPSVSGRHAELFLDPHGQWIIRDLDSTNGTWVKSESVKAAPIQPNVSFRVGLVPVTPKQIVRKVRKVRGPASGGWSAMTPLTGIAIASSTLAIVLLGLFWLSPSRSQQADDRATDQDTAGMSPPASNATDPPLIAPSTPPASPVLASQPVGSVDRAESAVEPAPDATTRPAPASDPVPLTDIQRVLQSLFVIVENRGQNQISLASAWAVSPTMLITNAHVIESIDKNQYDARAIHLASGTEFPIAKFGYHPSYLESQQTLAEMVTEIKRLQKQIADSGDSESEQALALVQQGKQRASSVVQTMDTFDVGWLSIENEGTDVIPIELKTVPIEPSKSLRLANTYLEKESAIFVAQDRAVPGFLAIRASQEPLVDPNNSAPIRWAGQFKSAPDQWSDYHFSGCPVVSLRGRLVGLCCGFSRRIISNDSASSNDNGLIDTIDIVPFQVIEQLVKDVSQ